MFESLNDIQINVLLASILGDGELTKLYKNSRRKNSSYREHFGESQYEYREWKIKLMNGLFYITPKSLSLRSASHPLFTQLLKLFYNQTGKKRIPFSLLPYCNKSHFLTILYFDDGSLSISHKINHNKKLIYLTPHIFLYLQNYTTDELTYLKIHIKNTFDIELKLSKRNDGCGTILRTTSVAETFKYLNCIKNESQDCKNMYYKSNWDFRFKIETQKWKTRFSDYKVISTSSDRYKNYSEEEIQKLILLKKARYTDKEIANELGRSYWSIIYKLSELRKLQLL